MVSVRNHIKEWTLCFYRDMLTKRLTIQMNRYSGDRDVKTRTHSQTQPLNHHQYGESSEKATLEFLHPDHTTTQHNTNSDVAPTMPLQSRWADFTLNLSLVPLTSMRELRHSPTTMPICLIRTTLLSRWLCMPPSIHWSKSEKRGIVLYIAPCPVLMLKLLRDFRDQMLVFVPDRSSCSSLSSSRFTLRSKALLTYSCCSRGVCFTALGLAQAWDTDRNTWEHRNTIIKMYNLMWCGCWPS